MDTYTPSLPIRMDTKQGKNDNTDKQQDKDESSNYLKNISITTEFVELELDAKTCETSKAKDSSRTGGGSKLDTLNPNGSERWDLSDTLGSSQEKEIHEDRKSIDIIKNKRNATQHCDNPKVVNSLENTASLAGQPKSKKSGEDRFRMSTDPKNKGMRGRISEMNIEMKSDLLTPNLSERFDLSEARSSQEREIHEDIKSIDRIESKQDKKRSPSKENNNSSTMSINRNHSNNCATPDNDQVTASKEVTPTRELTRSSVTTANIDPAGKTCALKSSGTDDPVAIGDKATTVKQCSIAEVKVKSSTVDNNLEVNGNTCGSKSSTPANNSLEVKANTSNAENTLEVKVRKTCGSVRCDPVTCRKQRTNETLKSVELCEFSDAYVSSHEREVHEDRKTIDIVEFKVTSTYKQENDVNISNDNTDSVGKTNTNDNEATMRQNDNEAKPITKDAHPSSTVANLNENNSNNTPEDTQPEPKESEAEFIPITNKTTSLDLTRDTMTHRAVNYRSVSREQSIPEEQEDAVTDKETGTGSEVDESEKRDVPEAAKSSQQIIPEEEAEEEESRDDVETEVMPTKWELEETCLPRICRWRRDPKDYFEEKEAINHEVIRTMPPLNSSAEHFKDNIRTEYNKYYGKKLTGKKAPTTVKMGDKDVNIPIIKLEGVASTLENSADESAEKRSGEAFKSDDKAAGLDDTITTVPAVTISPNDNAEGASTSTPVATPTTNTTTTTASQSNTVNYSLAAACPSISKRQENMLYARANNLSPQQQLMINATKPTTSSTNTDKHRNSTGSYDKPITFSRLDENILSVYPNIPVLETSSTGSTNTYPNQSTITMDSLTTSEAVNRGVSQSSPTSSLLTSTYTPRFDDINSLCDSKQQSSSATIDNSKDIHNNVSVSKGNTLSTNTPTTATNTITHTNIAYTEPIQHNMTMSSAQTITKNTISTAKPKLSKSSTRDTISSITSRNTINSVTTDKNTTPTTTHKEAIPSTAKTSTGQTMKPNTTVSAAQTITKNTISTAKPQLSKSTTRDTISSITSKNTINYVITDRTTTTTLTTTNKEPVPTTAQSALTNTVSKPIAKPINIETTNEKKTSKPVSSNNEKKEKK